jgi:hypothetical protein
MDELKDHTPGGFPMTKLKSLVTGTTAIMLLLGVPSWAAEQPGLATANNDSVYVDGNSFKIVPGKGKGDASALINKLDARELGAGEIIFRSGGKLFTIAAPFDQQRYGSDRRDYGSDRRDYGSDRYGSDRRDYGSDRYGSDRRDYGSDRRDYASDRYGSDRRDYGSDRYGSDRRDYGSDRRDYGSDRRDYGSDRRDYGSDRRDYGSDRRDYASDRVVINDPEYADYKLKKIFADNWTASETK